MTDSTDVDRVEGGGDSVDTHGLQTLRATLERDQLHLQQSLVSAKVYFLIRFFNFLSYFVALVKIDEPVLGPVELLRWTPLTCLQP